MQELKKIQEEHHQRATQLQEAIRDLDNRIQAIQYDYIGSQGKIRAKELEIAVLHQLATQLQRRGVGYLENEDKNNGITIVPYE